jgi:tetratricopeptide (TPR) repeat protein
MEESFRVLSEDEPDEGLATLAAQLARFHFFRGDLDPALDRAERALEMAEALGLPDVLSQTLNTKSILINAKGRPREALALMRYALEVALENDLSASALRAFYNQAELAMQADRHREAAELVQRGMDLARRVGNQYWEWLLNGQIFAFIALGEWETALSMTSSVPTEKFSEVRGAFVSSLGSLPFVLVQRGELEEARKLMESLAEMETSADVQERCSYTCGATILFRAEGRYEDALDRAEYVMAAASELGFGTELVKTSFVEAVEAALALGRLDQADDLIGGVEQRPPGAVAPFFVAEIARLRAKLAALRGEPDVPEAGFKRAAGMFRELEMPFWLAAAQLEHAEWLVDIGREDEARSLVEEAREVFERLRARPWTERAAKLGVTAEIPG